MSKPKIEIKEENKGKFTDWCKGQGYDGVTEACIDEGLAARSAKTRARAQFAENTKKWKNK